MLFSFQMKEMKMKRERDVGFLCGEGMPGDAYGLLDMLVLPNLCGVIIPQIWHNRECTGCRAFLLPGCAIVHGHTSHSPFTIQIKDLTALPWLKQFTAEKVWVPCCIPSQQGQMHSPIIHVLHINMCSGNNRNFQDTPHSTTIQQHARTP